MLLKYPLRENVSLSVLVNSLLNIDNIEHELNGEKCLDTDSKKVQNKLSQETSHIELSSESKKSFKKRI